jgi:hypothetical protein
MACNASYTRFIFWKVFHMYYNLICTPICTKFYSCKKWVLQVCFKESYIQRCYPSSVFVQRSWDADAESLLTFNALHVCR